MADVEDVPKSDVGLNFFIWMLMSSMIGTVSYKSWAHDILFKYQEESVGQWSPILLGLGCCQ
jgi:hypothetical protein